MLTVVTGSTIPPSFQRLTDRLAGLAPDKTLRPGVPLSLVRPLQEWLTDALFLREDLAQSILLRLDWHSEGYPKSTQYREVVRTCARDDLLVAVDAVLQLHPDWDDPTRKRTELKSIPMSSLRRQVHTNSLTAMIGRLERLLTDGASELRVDAEAHCLVRRVDATVNQAAMTAVNAAGADASDHLRTAWVESYGLKPDPDAAYREAVRAVEAVACPLVQPNLASAGKATLGTTIGELKNNARHKWELVIPSTAGIPGDILNVVAMLEILWQGQVSRHAGGAQNRRQSQAEAEAAVHLAAILVQWFTSGAIRPTT